MRIEVTRVDDRMAPSGKAILRSLQNESMPIVDLVIRESFQNSLDATISGAKETKIAVDTCEVNTNDIAPYFEGIQTTLENKFPNGCKVLSISDKNTIGLTGAINTTDKKELNESNIYKLIYGLNMNQEEEGAGGSWGLGKTSFFRIGCGIVIYYTRIKKNDGFYEERLAACLIENSDKPDAIMPTNDRGVAWWGEKESEADDYEKTYPITDSKMIHEFLRKIGKKPYKNEETGTSIIIPFIDDESIIVSEDELESNAFWWEKDLVDSLKMAIRRWYAPRIMNIDYSNRFDNSLLIPTVNGETISPLTYESTFKWFYKLYSSALTNISNDSKITVKPIYLKQLGMNNKKNPVGSIAYAQLDLNDLEMIGGNSSLSPLAYIGDKTHIGNPITGGKILAYARKPGMVVQYSVDDTGWMKGLPVAENVFVLAFFVPNSEGMLHSNYQPRYGTLESYLRDTENADHALWIDKYIGAKPITIIERIKKEVSKTILDDLVEREQSISSSKTSGLSRKFGSMLLPNANFGKSSSSRREKEKTGEGESRNRLSDIQITNFKPINRNNMIVEFIATIRSNAKSKIFFEVDTTEKKINEATWEKSFEDSIDFPFEFIKLNIGEIDNKIFDQFSETEDFEIIAHPNNESASFEIKNNRFKEITIKGTIYLLIKDTTMQPNLAIKTQPVIKKVGEE